MRKKNPYTGEKKTHGQYSSKGAEQAAIVNRKRQIANYEMVIRFLLNNEGQYFNVHEVLEGSKAPIQHEYLKALLSHVKHSHLWKHIPKGYVLHKEWREIMVMGSKGHYKIGSPQYYYCLRPITSYDEELLTNPPIEEEKE